MSNVPDFERDLTEALGERIRNDNVFAQRVYAALSNVQWQHERWTYGATWRYAGGLVARIRGRGESYLDYYCSGIGEDGSTYNREGTIDPAIADALEGYGWHGVTAENEWRPYDWTPENEGKEKP